MKKQKVLRVLTSKELEKLTSINNEFYTNIIQLLSNTGLRISELLSLNIDVKGKDTISVNGKGSKQRLVPLNLKAKESIEFFVADSQKKLANLFNPKSPLICSIKKRRMSRATISKKLIQIRESLDFDIPFSAHTFRHQFANTLLQKGNNLNDIKDLLGHSSIQTTVDLYCHSTNESLRKAVETLN